MRKLEIINSKIFKNREDMKSWLAYWKFHDQKVVFTNGCFDLIHRGHIDYLAKAAEHGDVLIIGLNTDSSVNKIKGENRPVQDEESRALILAALQFVNAVVLFDEETPKELIELAQPDVLVKGSDYNPEDIVGYDVVKAKNGEVVTISYLEGFSTSGIINKIINTQ
nr:D-glycero-beta-D-manno-heptose 1-phosphate adenylyltransferase [Bacteroidota bacterium]